MALNITIAQIQLFDTNQQLHSTIGIVLQPFLFAFSGIILGNQKITLSMKGSLSPSKRKSKWCFSIFYCHY